MKKFLLFAFAAVMLGFAGCNDDENKDNIPPTLREYEAPVFMYGKTREEVKASVPYAYSGASETSLYFEGKGIKGRFKKWWFTSVGVFPVDRSGGSKSLGALNHAREIIEDGHLFGIHIEGTRSPDGRLYKGHTGAARLAFETGCPIIPAAIIGSRELQKPGQVIPNKGKSKVIYGKPIEVEKKSADQITHDDLRSLTDRVTREIQKMSGQEYVDEYAQKVKAELKAQQEAEAQAQAESAAKKA